MSQPEHITLGGAPEGFDARLLARELEKRGAPVVHVARDDKRLAEMRAALAFLAPGVTVLDFPAWDCLPYDRVSPHADISAARMATPRPHQPYPATTKLLPANSRLVPRRMASTVLWPVP